jgi:hypothetical protein
MRIRHEDRKESSMKRSTRYRVNGLFHVVRGTLRVFAARIGAKRTLAAKGRVERIAGKLQGSIGKAHSLVGL